MAPPGAIFVESGAISLYHRSFRGATISKPALASFSVASAARVFHSLSRPPPPDLPAFRNRLNRPNTSAAAMPTTPAIAAFGGPISVGLTSGSGFFLI